MTNNDSNTQLIINDDLISNRKITKIIMNNENNNEETSNLTSTDNNNLILIPINRKRLNGIKERQRLTSRNSDRSFLKIDNNFTYDYKQLHRTNSLTKDYNKIVNNQNQNKQDDNLNSNSLFQTKLKLLHELDIQVCKCELEHNSILSKLLNHHLVRRWKHAKLKLEDTRLIIVYRNDDANKLVIHYESLKDLNLSNKSYERFIIRLEIMDFYYLIQTNNMYIRDQLYYSLMWKRSKHVFENSFKTITHPERIIKEIKTLVELTKSIPLDDNEINRFVFDLISEKLQTNSLGMSLYEDILITIKPLLDKNIPSQELCDFFSKHCKISSSSKIIIEMFTPLVERILKNVGDFGRYPRMKLFVRDYINTLLSLPSGLTTVVSFIKTMHGSPLQCPFPRVLQNINAVCLAGLSLIYENKKKNEILNQEEVKQIECYASILLTMTNYDDWRLHLSSLLQSLPFPSECFKEKTFFNILKAIVTLLAEDPRCEVHLSLLGLREGKQGWLDLFSTKEENLDVFELILKSLIQCCCRKKKFLISLNKFIQQIELMALRENSTAIETLCAMLELDTIENQDYKSDIIATLKSTNLGRQEYALVCEKQVALKEIQQKGGPFKLTLPNNSKDADLAKLLSSGHFGNLECLSLAFTNVTSACAQHLIKLPSLKSLNLWSTQFGDLGLEMICDHLLNLECLNLCETPVTDKALNYLTSLKKLKKINLNSTNLSALTYETLKENLPRLEECDIRYTDAW